MPYIKWHGHACFELVSDNGLVVGIDPHDGVSLGLRPPMFKADVILVTHSHFDHNAIQVISKPNSRVLDGFEGITKIDGIEVKGIRSYHDPYGGTLRGSTIVYRVVIDGISFVHLGDLGTIPSEKFFNELVPVDTLFIPVGGVYTIGASEAVKIIEKISPKIAVPMHYSIPGLRLRLHSVDDFIKKVKFNVNRLNRRDFSITKTTLPETTQIWILTYQ